MKIDSVVSCATKKHIKVWEYTSKYLNKYILAENYYVIVPPDQITLFKDITPSNFNILNEEEIVPNPKCEGWIYQQLLKIEATSIFGPRVLIWDGDTVPLKPMSDVFFPEEDIIQIFTSSEYHVPYFNTINHLLNIPSRLVDFSFIAQCLPVYSKDIQYLKTCIEETQDKQWVNAIINAIRDTGRFSEYETIGNFILHNNLRKILKFSHSTQWGRHVWHRINKWKDIDNLVEGDLYFASFETAHNNAPNWAK